MAVELSRIPPQTTRSSSTTSHIFTSTGRAHTPGNARHSNHPSRISTLHRSQFPSRSLHARPKQNHRNRTGSPHDRPTEYLFIELMFHKKQTDGFFILNIYNAPSLRNSRLLTLFKKELNAAGGSPLVIGGDVNLPHTGWGYKHCSGAGRNLW